MNANVDCELVEHNATCLLSMTLMLLTINMSSENDPMSCDDTYNPLTFDTDSGSWLHSRGRMYRRQVCRWSYLKEHITMVTATV